MKIITGIIIFFATLIASTNVFCKAPRIFIISVNGFRSDYLQRGLTPNINSLAQNGVKAELKSIFPTMNYPAHISLFTGCYPVNHGILSDVFENKNTGEYFDSRVPETYNDPKWYDARFIWEYAEKFGIYSAMVMIPGASLNSHYKSSYFFIDEKERLLPEYRISESIKFLKEDAPHTPRLIAVSFDDTDDTGHKYGTATDSINSAIKRIDRYVGIIIDSLKSIGVFENTNIIFLSTFGMKDVKADQIINIGEILYGQDIDILNAGAYAFIYCDEDKIDTVKSLLKKHEYIHTFSRNEIPDSLHIKQHPFAPDILVLPDYNRILIEKNDFSTYNLRGIHGYLPSYKDMHGVFVASGPNFKSNYTASGINLIDLFPMFCKILNIPPLKNIDGNLETIGKILK